MNVAQRLFDLLHEAAREPEKTRTRDVWAKVFGIPDEYQEHKLVAEVSMRLSGLHQETEALHTLMLETEVPREVFEPPLRKVEAAISATNIGAPWQTFKRHITPEVLLSLRYNSAILGSKERPIDETELENLLAEVADLEQKLTDADLPDGVRVLIEKQLQAIRAALGDYKIKGASAIKDAVHKAAGELIEHKEEIAKSRDSEVIGRLGQLWMRFTQLGDSLTKVDRALESGKRIWELIEPVFKSGG